MSSHLSIILISYNECDYLRQTLQRLEKEFAADTRQVIVVDNASQDASPAMVQQEFPWVELDESSQNLMYGKGNNRGSERARGEWLLFLNPDVDWETGALRAFVREAQSIKRLGVAGPRIMFPDGRTQVSAHRRWPNAWTVFVDYCLPFQQLALRAPYHPYTLTPREHRTARRVAGLTGVCLLIPRVVWQAVGGFDPTFSMYLEETDLERRIEAAGFENWLVPSGTVVHYGSAQKTYAQASQHYLWGLERYTQKHWSEPGRTRRLLLSLWAGTAVSDASLLIAWPLSLLFGRRVRRRVSHYLREYWRLTKNLIWRPRVTPQP